MTRVIIRQSTENVEYVHSLLQEKQPGFSAALEVTLVLAELELWSPQMPAATSATKAHDR